MTNNKQQTAVEWFLHELITFYIPEDLEEYGMFMKIVDQAKEMEKKQHKKTWLDSTCQFDNAAEMTFKKDFDEHYEQTYGGGEQ